MKSFRRIDAKTVYLRMFCLDDVEKIFHLSIEDGMKKWIPDQVYENTAHAREVLEFLIQQYQSGSSPREIPLVFGVCRQDDDELIGHVGLSPLDGEVEIGYAIETRHQGKGYATEAIRAMTDWAFAEFRLPCILGIVAAANIGSTKALEKAGFVLMNKETRMFHGASTLVLTYKKSAPPPQTA